VRGDVTHHRLCHVMRQCHLHTLALVQPFIVAGHQRHDRHAVLTNIHPACSLGISPSDASLHNGLQRAETWGVKQVRTPWRYEYAIGNSRRKYVNTNIRRGTRRQHPLGGACNSARQMREACGVRAAPPQASWTASSARTMWSAILSGPSTPLRIQPVRLVACELRAKTQSNYAARSEAPRVAPSRHGRRPCATWDVWRVRRRIACDLAWRRPNVTGFTLRLCSSANRSMAAFGSVVGPACMMSPLPAAWSDMERAINALRATPRIQNPGWGRAPHGVSNGRKLCTQCRRRPGRA
jgi:hypothetical protein